MSQEGEDDPYEVVVKEKLKLKSDDTIFVKKKSKKKKMKKFADSVKVMKTDEPVEEEKSTVIHRTKAQIAFEKQREKLVRFFLVYYNIHFVQEMYKQVFNYFMNFFSATRTNIGKGWKNTQTTCRRVQQTP